MVCDHKQHLAQYFNGETRALWYVITNNPSLSISTVRHVHYGMSSQTSPEGLICAEEDTEGLICAEEDTEGLICAEEDTEGLICAEEDAA